MNVGATSVVTVVGIGVSLSSFKPMAKYTSKSVPPSRPAQELPVTASGAHEVRLQAGLKNSEPGGVKLSDPILLMLKLENLSKRPVYYWGRNPEVDFDIEVKNSQGIILPLKPLIAAIKADRDFFGASITYLKPGEQREYEVDVGQVVDGLGPDIYLVVISRHEIYLWDESEDSICVHADPVQVVVLDAPK